MSDTQSVTDFWSICHCIMFWFFDKFLRRNLSKNIFQIL